LWLRDGDRVSHLQTDRFLHQLLEWHKVPRGCPELQLGVASRVQRDDHVFPAVVHFET
jgi:hypothetical protein